MTSVSPRLAPLRRFGWLTGLPALAAIIGLAGALGLPSLERRLKGEASAVATATENGGVEPWLQVTARGRDVVVKGEAPNRELRSDALARLQRLPGLRHVVGPLGVVEEASPFVWSATRATPNRIELSGNRPAEIGPVALAARLAPDLPAETKLKDDAKAARGAPPEFLPATTYAVEQLAGLSPGGVVTLTDTILSFKGEAASIASYDALRLALAAPPEGFSLGTVEILPPRIEDFRFAMARNSDAIVLSGNVVSETARSAIVARATEAANGLPVEDRMQTARGLSASIDPVALTGFALDLTGLLQDGTVSFSGSQLSVSGATIDAQAVGEIGALMREKRPAGIDPGAVSLATRPLSPYRLLVRREGDSVTVSGHVPDEATRERVLTALRPRFFRERIVDRLRIADGAPPDLAAALDAGVAALALLANGRAAVTDRALQLTGESLYRESATRLAETLPRKVPAGWRAEAAIQAPDGPVLSDPESCRRLFANALEGHTLRFASGSAALRADFYPMLDAVAALAKTCPSLRVTVAGHGDPPGAQPAKVESTEAIASPDPTPAKPKPEAAVKEPQAAKAQASTPPGKAEPSKPHPAKAAAKTAQPAKAAAAAKPQTDTAPEPDLPRQRALAIVDYLMKAGMAEGAVAVSGTPRPAQQGIGLALES